MLVDFPPVRAIEVQKRKKVNSNLGTCANVI